MQVTYRIVVAGRVQGVWFRASTHDEALKLGVTGYVRNLPDGRVEIQASGEQAKLDQLVNWCHDGPPLARVDQVDVKQTEFVPYDNFEVQR